MVFFKQRASGDVIWQGDGAMLTRNALPVLGGRLSESFVRSYLASQHAQQQLRESWWSANRPRVVDIFSYGGSRYDRTLRLRLEELSDVVSFFVVLEMGQSFARTGRRSSHAQPDAPRHRFNKSSPAFAPFADRIVHVNLGSRSLITSADPKRNEQIMRTVGVELAYSKIPRPSPDHDAVLVSDIDEIPRAESLRRLLDDESVRTNLRSGHVYALTGPSYYYDIECRVQDGHPEARWNFGPRLVLARALIATSWDQVRQHGPYRKPLPDHMHVHAVQRASWHFGWLMTLQEVRVKLCTNTDLIVRQACVSDKALETIRRAMAECKDPFGRPIPFVRVVARRGEIPDFALANLDQFRAPMPAFVPTGRMATMSSNGRLRRGGTQLAITGQHGAQRDLAAQ